MRRAIGPLPGFSGVAPKALPVVQPARPGQVHDQVQAALDGDVQELAVPPGVGDLLVVQRGRRRVVGLEHADRGHVHPRDAVPDDPLTQVRGEGLHLRQFRHAPTLASSPMKVPTP